MHHNRPHLMPFALNDDTWRATMNFVSRHAQDTDLARLALTAQRERGVDVDVAFALDQIAGRRRAADKIPSWAACNNIVYPPRVSMEQCSSEATARYKASLAAGERLIDLSGGLGVDCAEMALNFDEVTYVERDPHLCALANHNFAALSLPHIEVVNNTAEHYLEADTRHTSVIFIDPARRDTAGRRTYAIADCSPDVAALAPTLLERANMVIIKLSPMLDLSHVAASLPNVAEIHLVGAYGECKEILAVLRHESHSEIEVVCAEVTSNQTFRFHFHNRSTPVPIWNGDDNTAKYLYEPNATVMKSGAFGELAARFGVQMVGRDSHLFVSAEPVSDFSGRSFSVETITSMNRKELRHILAGIDRANIAVRNFPLSPDALRQRLHLQDGGDTFIFATRDTKGKTRLFICRKETKTAHNHCS